MNTGKKTLSDDLRTMNSYVPACYCIAGISDHKYTQNSTVAISTLYSSIEMSVTASDIKHGLMEWLEKNRNC